MCVRVHGYLEGCSSALYQGSDRGFEGGGRGKCEKGGGKMEQESHMVSETPAGIVNQLLRCSLSGAVSRYEGER